MCHMSHVRCLLSCVLCSVSCVICHVSCVMCHVSCVACHLSPVTCHRSLTPTARASYPPPANSPIMQSKLVCKDLRTPNFLTQKSYQSSKNQKMSIVVPILAMDLRPEVSSPPGSRFGDGTNRYTHTHARLMDITNQRLNWPSGPNQ